MTRSWLCVALMLLPACSDPTEPLLEMQGFEVQGVVRSTLSGNPVASVRVSAVVDRDLFGVTNVGFATADASGRFTLRLNVRRGDCGHLELRIEAEAYSAAPGLVAAFGRPITCESQSVELRMYPGILSVTIEPAALTTAPGAERTLQARGVFADGYTGLVPANHDLQGTLWNVLGTGLVPECGQLTPDLGANPIYYRAPGTIPGTACGAEQAGAVRIALRVEYGGRVIRDSVTVTIGP